MITGYKDKHEYTDDRGIHSVVYLMDCMDLMQQLPDKSIQLACVDPPYGINQTLMNMGSRKTIRPDKSKQWDNKTPEDNYFELLFNCSQNQVIWGGNYFNLPPSQYFAIWDKGETMYGRDFAECEYAWVRSGGTRIFKKNPKDPNRIHPTQKPTALYNWIFARYAKEGDTILDTHLGSGPSRISAAKAGLPFIGCELDEEYFYQHCKRFDAFAAQKTILFPK